MDIQGEIYIHSAAGAAWEKFSRLEEWPQWNREIIDAGWLGESRWQEGSTFQLRHKSLFGLTATTNAVLRMVVQGNIAVWETTGSLLQVVHSANFQDQVGGCLLSARHTYHGPLSLPLQLFRSRQQRLLEQGMSELKVFIEGPAPR